MHTATADPLVGRLLEGRYRIQARIARGGMSTVYSALDERLDRLVAVKVMSGALSSDPAFADRFAREARAAAKLSHLNAVAVYDQGEDISPAGHFVFLVMELVSGRTLRDLIRERGPLSPALAVSVMEPVLGALAAAHRAGLVHRDVKPENILLSDDGVVKVADFGLARAVEADAAATRTGLMMGTVAYCSPEQISRGRTDQRSDVYSAGVVLFELLTGEAPYVGESAMAVAYQHVHSRVPAPSSRIGHSVPEPLDELVVRVTDSDPSGRPLDAGAFLAELHDVRTDLGLPVVPVPPRQRPESTAAPARPAAGPPGGPAAAPARAGFPPRPATHPAVTAHNRTTDRLAPGGRTHDTTIADPFGARPSATVTPAPPSRPPRSARSRRRRRALIVLLVVLLLGAGAGYGGWWLASGRYKHVPDVSGEPRDTALSALSQAGIKHVSITTAYSESVDKGAVISTDPGAGQRLLPDRTVTVTVSLGKQRCTLPKVAGGTEAQARAALARCPFPLQVVATQRADDTVPAGQVIGTTPQSGAQVAREQAVTIVVSTGPPILTVPDVGGKNQDDATKALTDAGFKVSVAQQFSDTVDEGNVIAQSPSGNAQAPKFSTVTITVSKGPELVTIPTIPAGTPVDDARRQLEDLGLKVRVQKAFGGTLGQFVGSDPQAGQQVRKGDRVTIYVV